MLFDRRCTGNSSCPTGEKGNRHAADVATAVRHPAPLRCPESRRGRCLRRGAVAIGSCVVVDIRGCVALSPALFDLKLGDRLTANIAIARVRAPLLVADAPDDSDSPITEVQTLLRRARPGVVLFARLPAAPATAGTPSTTPTTLIAAQRSPPASPPSSTAT